MKVLVCGGRDYNDQSTVSDWLDTIHDGATHMGSKIECIIEGGAQGADACGARWADDNSVRRITFPADWNSHGRKAGPMRNSEMITKGEPDLVLAFPGGAGTADMVRKAKAAGIAIVEITKRGVIQHDPDIRKALGTNTPSAGDIE